MFREATCWWEWGKETVQKTATTPKKLPYQANRLDIIAHLNRGYACLRSLTNAQLQEHARRETNYFFAGNGNPYNEFTLALMDVDGDDTLTSWEFTQDVIRNVPLFHKMFNEASTYPGGWHGYFFVHKSARHADKVNKALGELDRWLKGYANDWNANRRLRELPTIKTVEIKGQAPEVTFHDYPTRHVANLTRGTLAKCPREMLTRPQDFANTSIFNLDQLWELVDSQPVTITRQLAREHIERGSCGRWVEDVVDDFETQFMARGRRLCRHCGTQVKYGLRCEAEDWASFFVVMSMIAKKPNKDGSIPTDGIKQLWEKLYNTGVLPRQHDDSRVAFMRNKLTTLGCVNWESNEYWWYEERGRDDRKKGQACRWSLMEQFLELLDGDESRIQGGVICTRQFSLILPKQVQVLGQNTRIDEIARRWCYDPGGLASIIPGFDAENMELVEI